MKQKLILVWWGFAALNMIAATTATAASTATQSSAKVWAEVARWPDLTTGIWMKERSEAERQDEINTERAMAPLPPGVVLTPQAQAIRKAREPARDLFESTKCLPPGPLRMVDFPTAFFYAGTSIFLMTDMDAALQRRVIMNAKAPPSEAFPSWSGTSTGHWEGSTLVIDTTLIRAGIILGEGVPSSGGAHIVERIRLIEPNRLEWKVTVEDPEVLQKPWTYINRYKRQSDWQLQPASCTESNRDAITTDGEISVDLTPPK